MSRLFKELPGPQSGASDILNFRSQDPDDTLVGDIPLVGVGIGVALGVVAGRTVDPLNVDHAMNDGVLVLLEYDDGVGLDDLPVVFFINNSVSVLDGPAHAFRCDDQKSVAEAAEYEHHKAGEDHESERRADDIHIRAPPRGGKGPLGIHSRKEEEASGQKNAQEGQKRTRHIRKDRDDDGIDEEDQAVHGTRQGSVPAER